MKFKSIIKSVLFLAFLAAFASCKKDKEIEDETKNELEGLKLAQVMANDNHRIEVYTATGEFQTGYNQLFFQIRNTEGTLIKNASATWMPVMHMMSMSHACPYSAISKMADAESTYAGYIIFQMAGNDSEYWELTIDYTIDGSSYSAKSRIAVKAAARRIVESFQGSDSKRYVLALMEPAKPAVGLNTMKAILFERKSMMEYNPLSGYKILIDPRMPGMGNHGSPNNVDLSDKSGGVYEGKVSLTMTGYWKVNMQLLDGTDTLVKGEAVSDTSEASSLYFELEF